MIKLKKLNLLLCFVFMIFLLDCNTYAGDFKKDIKKYDESLKNQQNNLENLQTELKKREKDFKVLNDENQSLSKDLNKLNKDISGNEKTLKNLKKDIKYTKIASETTQGKISNRKQALLIYEDNLKNELNIIYRRNKNIEFLTLLSEDFSYGYFLRNDKALKTIVDEDFSCFVEAQTEIINLGQLLDEFNIKKESMISLKTTVSKKQKSSLKEKEKKSLLLKKVVAKKTEQEKEIAKLKENIQELENLIIDLRYKLSETEKKRIKKLGLVGKKGNIIWPVKGEITSLFGKYKHAQLGTYLFNNGIEIKTDKKTDVVAVEEGIVIFASDFKGYGKTVIIEHNQDFCTVYSHLLEINVRNGDSVKKKDIIGTVDSFLYFEIRLENKPEDPLFWLASDQQRR